VDDDARAALASLALGVDRRVVDHAPLWLTLPLRRGSSSTA
jgi:hypothetical protein